MVRVKICGIRDSNTAQAVIKLGADALGFVFAPSSRQISPEEAREIICSLPPLVSKVGVFVDALPAEVRRIAQYCCLDVVQLHGDETPQYVQQLNWPVTIKAFRVKNAGVLRQIVDYPVQAVLLDTYIPGVAGGSGQTFNWQLLQAVPVNRPVILAGGLTPDNVNAAIQAVQPYAVDVSSGVETGGIKDLEKVALFIKNAKKGANTNETK
ncbi:MAG: phosphoribosylanthranilate isomerase [Desulfotomaculum sp.]|nr:phosphoribosylanthranilate isomerase [Desulfotomaculum sp.]